MSQATYITVVFIAVTGIATANPIAIYPALYVPLAQPSAPSSCPSSNLRADTRQVFLDEVNLLRSRVAGGHEPEANSTRTAPPASNMRQMSYNCSLEATAYRWAQKCQWGHSGTSGVGENIYAFGNCQNCPAVQPNQIANNSMLSWWGELQQYGIPADNVLTTNVFNTGVGHYTQLAWATSYSVGCYVQNCPAPWIFGNDYNGVFVVCQFYPPGNYLGEKIYEIGSAASQCPSGTSRSGNLCAA